MATPAPKTHSDTLRTLPGDDVRQIMWRFADRYDLQMLVQSSRAVARGPVARLVAEGGRNTHEWTARQERAARRTSTSPASPPCSWSRSRAASSTGPKNLALALAAFELAWVDAGAATGSLAGCLGLSPIHETRHAGAARSLHEPRRAREARRGPQALARRLRLTEPIPYVGVETGMLGGKVRVARVEGGRGAHAPGREARPLHHQHGVRELRHRRRGLRRPAHQGHLHGDPRGDATPAPSTAARRRGSSSTSSPPRSDPIFSLRVPASRIVGGYTVKDGVIVPNFDHGEVIEAVFRRTRVTVGVMTSAKLLCAVEPVIRYQRGRFRGARAGARPARRATSSASSSARTSLHRLVDVWATGEAGASLGFATARALRRARSAREAEGRSCSTAQGITGHEGRDEVDEGASRSTRSSCSSSRRTRRGAKQEARIAELRADEMVRFALLDAQANVLCPAASSGTPATARR